MTDDDPVTLALQKIGNSSKYQYLLTVLFFFVALQLNSLIIGSTYIYMNPLFTCSFTDKEVDESIACDRISECKIMYDFTLVASSQLYCEKQFERSLIQAISPLGAIFGLIIINFISDSKGRKVGFVIALLLAILSVLTNILGGLLNYIWLLAVSQFINGFSGYSLMIMMFIIPAEYCENEFRQKVLIVISGAWSLSYIMIGLLFTYSIHWYNYLIYAVLIPLFIILIFSLLFLVEGPKFLYRKRRQEQCLESLKTIAKYNNTLLEYEKIKESIKYINTFEETQDQMALLKQVFKNSYYKKLIVVLISIEIGGNINYMGLNYSLDQIGYDYGTNMIFNGCVQICSYAIMGFFITKMERRKWLLIFYGSIALVGLLFFMDPIKENHLVTVIIVGVLRFLGTFAFTLLIFFLTQAFPLNVQASCTGLVQAFSQFGMFLAPIIINVCILLQVYPIIVISFLVMILMFLPLLTIKMPAKQIQIEAKQSQLLTEQQKSTGQQ